MILELLLYSIFTAQLILIGVAVALLMLTNPKKSNRERIEDLERKIDELNK